MNNIMAITVGNFGRQPIKLGQQAQNETKEVVKLKVEESSTSAASASSNEAKDIPLDTWKAYGGVNQKITKKVLLDTKEKSKPEVDANKVPKKEDITTYEDLQKRFNNGEFEDLTGVMQGTIYSEDGHLYYWCVARSAETGKITLETKQIF